MLSNDIKYSRSDTKIDELSGKTVGVIIGWESDYLLSDREDINLKRYESAAELFMALNYKQIDVVVVDEATLMQAQGSLTGIKILGEPLTTIQYTIYIKKGDDKTMNEMNEFIDAFKKSDEYEKFVEHYYDLEWIKSGQLSEQTGTGEEIKIAYITDYYPFEYITENNTPEGSEVEFAIQFANYYNYRIKWVESTPNTAYMDIIAGKAQIVLTSATDVYRRETLHENVPISMSQGYIDSRLFCIVADGKISILNQDLFKE